MRISFTFRDNAVDYIRSRGFRYCETVGWFGWWNIQTCERAIVDFNSRNKINCWTVTIWKTKARNLPPANARYMK